MQKQEIRERKALLAVSFGTTHEATRAATIDAIERDLAEAFPDRKLYRGWTSRMIVGRLRERGVHFDTLEEALERMRGDGITDILVQPTHIIEGAENDRMLQALEKTAENFSRILVGRPLLSSEEDRIALAQILAEELLPRKARSGRNHLVLMGHGSAKKPEANRIYPLMEQAFRQAGYKNAYVGTVEGTPEIAEVLEKLGRAAASEDTVYLAPMMIVAGDHAKNDMAGEDEDSWRNLIAGRGFSVVPVLKGLGESQKVREMFCRHAEEAAEFR